MADLHSAPYLFEQVAAVVKPLARASLFFLDRTSPLYWPYLLGTILFALIGWRLFERKPGEPARGFLRRHFAAAHWWHPSARADYRFYLINAVIFALAVTPLLLSAAWFADRVKDALGYWLGASPGRTASIGVRALYTLLFFVAYDLGRWLAHTALHDVPPLWEFHKVHHSAEVLTPITAFRVHPVDLLITLSVPALTTAPVVGLFAYLYPAALNAYSFLGLNLVIGLSGLIANLKHWQVWFTYGPLDGWWISPAHHQIHHSADPKHWGRNRGFELGIWDRWYGTLHIPARENEIGKLGLGDGSDGEWHSVRRLYFRPFANAFRLMHSGLRKLIAAVVVAVLVFTAPRMNAADEVRVELEQLTWPELAERIRSGSATVLVPIGGTEQNGPAMTFAKHNEIVRYASAEIARRLGAALVAPVLPFAPEGTFAPRAGNQQWPGTIGLREETLSAVLEDEVTSLALAGFRTIVFLGDHGGSQHAQAEVAQRLGGMLATRGVRVLNLDRYYEPASLAERLKAVGVDPANGGDHAGLVDTAELMSVKPELIRRDRLDPKHWNDFATAPGPGGSGRPDLATAELGRALLEQRIAAGLAQLRDALARKAKSP